MLVGTDDTHIDKMNLPIEVALFISLLLKRFKDLLPQPNFTPVVKSPRYRGPRIIALRQVPPRCTRAKHLQDAIDDGAMVFTRTTRVGFLWGQQGFQSIPLAFG